VIIIILDISFVRIVEIFVHPGRLLLVTLQFRHNCISVVSM